MPTPFFSTAWKYAKAEPGRELENVAGIAGAVRHPINFLSGGALPEAEAIRAQQKDLAAMLRDAALGKTPSAAEAQMRMAQDRAVAQQYALAASAHGLAPAEAARQASMGASDVSAQIAQQSSALRALEQERARMALLQALQAQRAQEFEQARENFRPIGTVLGAAGQVGAAAAMA